MMNLPRVIFQVYFILKIQLIFAKMPSKKISVMFSQRKPFVIENGLNDVPRGLDVSILQNFAQQFQIEIEYIRSNKSLNTIFYSEKTFKQFMEKKSHK